METRRRNSLVTQITTTPTPAPLPPDDVKWSTVPLSEVLDRGARFEAAIYDVEGKHAREVLLRCRWQVVGLWSADGFVKTASYPTRFKRIYVDHGGIGLLLPSQLTEIDPKPGKFISAKSKTDFEILKVNENEVLLTRSGTIGNCTLVSKTLAGKVFSDDVIRVELKDPNEAGYLYAFLKTEIGNTLIQTNNYGAVVSHIEPEHLKKVPIPNPSPIIKTAVHNLIAESFRLRDESNEHMAEAERLLISALGLPPIEEMKVKQFNDSADCPNFTVKLSKLAARLEATYHKPLVDAIHSHIEKQGEVTNVGDSRISKNVILPGRFKRVYVGAGQGVAFFGGKELLSLDPRGDKYLSLRHHDERITSELTIKENMVMVTCSGTIAKVSLAPKHWEGWTANQHILRVVPASKAIAGYLYIWLASDYGYELIKRFTYGAVVDEIDDNHMRQVRVPLLKDQEVQKRINDLALEANRKRYEAFLLEEQAIDTVNKKVIFASDSEQGSTSAATPPSPLGLEFRGLVDKWRKDTQHTSSLTKMIAHPSYKRIIEMVRAVLPLLFAELEARRDHWLFALNAITGKDPAPKDSTFAEAVDAWLTWGREKGYLSSECGETEKLRNVSQG
jgi:type I restriction enzyme S subunit